MSLEVDGDPQREINGDEAATLEILGMITAIPGWINRVYAERDRMESEPWVVVQVGVVKCCQGSKRSLQHLDAERSVFRLIPC